MQAYTSRFETLEPAGIFSGLVVARSGPRRLWVIVWVNRLLDIDVDSGDEDWV